MRPKVRLRSVVKGAGSFFMPSWRTAHVEEGGAHYARYCYEVFLRHYTHYQAHASTPQVPSTVAELGPGSSLGCGFAALLAGAERFVALDLQHHFSAARNLAIFDQLVTLFEVRARAGVLDIYPPCKTPDFPADLEAVLHRSLERGRLERIRGEIGDGGGAFFSCVAPWDDVGAIAPETVDWLFSHSVLEHVDDLAGAYASMAAWLRPGALSTHLIDFASHGLTREWNGHWGVTRPLWALIRGKRPYLINRAWRSQHLRLIADNGFVVRDETIANGAEGLHLADFTPEFAVMTKADAGAHMSFLVLEKPRLPRQA